MKVLFICGCLEPGRDGVGDYVRRLSEELIRHHHHPYALAINDTFVETNTISSQKPGNRCLSALRLPSASNRKQRLKQAKLWMDIVDSDIVSIQYVPFSFHVKGLPLSLGRDIKYLAGNRPVHFMVHETWVGTNPSSSIKQRLYSFLQRQILKRVMRKTKPTTIHSHLPTYCKQLEQLGFDVKPLPLFSNIPFSEKPGRQEDTLFRMGFLSQAEPTAEILGFLKDIIAELSETGAQLQLLLIGGAEEKMKSYRRDYELIPELKGQVVLTGFLQDVEVSSQIQTCNLGITPVPRHALGKSGSVAAFLSHGIPVAAPVVHQNFKNQDIGFLSASLRKAIMLEPSIKSFAAARKEALAVKNEIILSTIVKSFTTDLNIN